MPTTMVAPGVWRIAVPLPFRPRTVHAYLLETGADGLALVDGGAHTDDGWEALDAGVHGVAGGWDAVRLHVVTHMHLDHIGLARRIREASGAPLAMGRLDAERAAHAALHPDEEARYRELLLVEAGAPPDLIARATAVNGAAAAAARFVECDVPLAEPTADLPGAPDWRAIWSPGHTAGHVSLHRATDGVVVAGDAVLPGISPTIGVNRQRPDPIADYLDALDRIAGLPPRLILPGHGDPIGEPGPRLAELRAETLAESRRVLELLAAERRTAAEVAEARYAGRELPPAQRVQAIRECVAHLHHLVALGRVASGQDGRTVRFWQN